MDSTDTPGIATSFDHVVARGCTKPSPALRHPLGILFPRSYALPCLSAQAYFTTDSALSLSVEPTDGVLTPFGTDGTPLTVTYAPTQYSLSQKGLLVVETQDIR